MSDLNVSLVLRLIDRATGPARAAISNIQGAAAAASRAGARTLQFSNAQLASIHASRGALQGQAVQAAAAGAALALAVKPAIDMERSMAGVRKVIDFQNQSMFATLQNDILALTSAKGIPMAAEGIASIIESAGQAGIINAGLADDEKRRQLVAYAEAAAKMGVAFDVSAEAAGAAMTMWRSRLKMTHDDAMVMGDAVNHLSNNMDATAGAILNVINRQGAVAQSSGLVREEIAALSAAFVAAAPSPEIAATGMKNFLSVMTTGEGLTKGKRSVLAELGIDAETLAKTMQVDAKGAIMDVMDALSELPAHAQAAALTKLFGEESKSAITPLLTNLDMLRGAFDLVGDGEAFAGSMLKEYASQASTTAAGVMKLTGFMKALSVTVGSAVLPEINRLLGGIYPVLQTVQSWAAANPALIATGLKLAAGLVVLKLATLGARWAFLTLQLPIFHALRGLGWMTAAVPRLAMGMLSLINPMNLARFAVVAFQRALFFSGAGAVIAAIALGGAWIYNNWAGLKQFFSGFGAGFMAALGPAAPLINRAIAAGERLWAWLKKIVGPLNLTAEAWHALGVQAGEAIGGILAKISAWTGANPGLLAGILKLTAGLVALRAVLLLPARLVFGTFRAVARGARLALLPLRLLTRGLSGFLRGFRALAGLRPVRWSGRLIPRIPWARLAGRFNLSKLLYPFQWTARLIGKIPWARLAGHLNLARLIRPFQWTARLIGKIPWARLAGHLNLARLIHPFQWTARLIGKIPWARLAGRLDLARLVQPLAWTARLVPKLPWAKLVGTLALTSLIRPINWTQRTLPNFAPAMARFTSFRQGASQQMNGLANDVAAATSRMNRNISRVRWSALGLGVGSFLMMQSAPTPRAVAPLPEDPRAREAEIARRSEASRVADASRDEAARDVPGVGQIMMAYDWVFKKIHGMPPPVTASAPFAAPPRTDLSTLTPDQIEAANTIRTAKSGGLPMDRVRQLAEYKETLLGEIRALEAKLASVGEGPQAGIEEAKIQGALRDVQAELDRVEADLQAATAEAVALKNALGEFSDTPVTINVDHAQLDAALAKAAKLAATLRGLSGATTPPPASDAPVQARAQGGAFTPGWLLTGEKGPELRYTHQGGYIAHNRALRAMLAMSGLARRNVSFAQGRLHALLGQLLGRRSSTLAPQVLGDRAPMGLGGALSVANRLPAMAQGLTASARQLIAPAVPQAVNLVGGLRQLAGPLQARAAGGVVYTSGRSLARFAPQAANLVGGLRQLPSPLQARATGGAFNPGWLLTGERGPELRFPSAGGFAGHAAGLRAAVTASDTARRGAALASRTVAGRFADMPRMTTPATLRMAGTIPRIDTRPAARSPSARSGPGGRTGNTTMNVTITVNAAPGQDAQAVAREVGRQLQQLERRQRRGDDALHDGGDYDVA